MPPDRRTLRDIRQAYEGFKNDYQLNAGQWVQWFQFNPAATTAHPIYDTGPQRAWNTGVTVPVLEGIYTRAEQNFDQDGLYLVDSVRLIISYKAYLQALLKDPDSTGMDHLNDRVVFDNHLFSVDSFVPRGRIASYFLTISVDLTEVAQEELDEDNDTGMWDSYIVAGSWPGGTNPNQ
jgi:hypothetical protein